MSQIRVQVQIPLACGCAVQHVMSHERTPGEDLSDEAVSAALKMAANTLAYWYEVRIHTQNRHRCELVSEDNPNGFSKCQ